MLFTLANKQVDYLIKSDFNSLTCLLIGKLFEYSSSEQTDKIKELEKEKFGLVTWSNVLCLYFDIQAVLLKNLKYLYLKDTIIFFGSYYEAIASVIVNSRQSFDLNLLEIVRTFCRYLVQVAEYKKELLINLPQTADFLLVLFMFSLNFLLIYLKKSKKFYF
jgi:hypothetical protein